MKKIKTLLFIFLFFYGLQAQNPIQKCGHDYVLEINENNFPGYKDAVNRSFDLAKNNINYNRNQLLTVPVVVHVVYKTPDENIPDEQIDAVIARLNEDYRHTNANAANIRPIFEDVMSDDPMIEFELIEVVRQSTTALFELDIFGGQLPDNVKQSSEGGSDAWNTKDYLNIWVCKIEGGALLGYAYPPADGCAPNWPAGSDAPAPELEGVVVHYEAFNVGATYTVQGTTIPIEGRTVTHEVGHYLGLRHVWGDGLLAQLGIPDCNVDDGVADTPNQGIPSQFACDTTQNSCTDGMPDLPDMFENYMDYADETCMAGFTQEQIAIMRSSLENCRTELIDGIFNSNQEVLILKEKMDVSPNPSNGIFTIQTDFDDYDSYEITIKNILGQSINKTIQEKGSQSFDMDLQFLDNGIYFVEIRKNNITAAQKIVISK